MESGSEHPIAQAVTTYADEWLSEAEPGANNTQLELTSFEAKPGQGVQAITPD